MDADATYTLQRARVRTPGIANELKSGISLDFFRSLSKRN